MSKEQPIIDDKSGEPEDRKLFEEYIYWTHKEVDCYNAAIDHAIEVVKFDYGFYMGGAALKKEIISKLQSLKK